jgi:hypothetical protein
MQFISRYPTYRRHQMWDGEEAGWQTRRSRPRGRASGSGLFAPSAAWTWSCPPVPCWACWGQTGRGKTTLVQILATLIKPDQGRARLAGFDAVEHPAADRPV